MEFQESIMYQRQINRGAQNVASVVARWCLWRVQRGPSGPVDYCVICIMPLLFGFIVFLQQNPAIKLLCNEGGRETYGVVGLPHSVTLGGQGFDSRMMHIFSTCL